MSSGFKPITTIENTINMCDVTANFAALESATISPKPVVVCVAAETYIASIHETFSLDPSPRLKLFANPPGKNLYNVANKSKMAK